MEVEKLVFPEPPKPPQFSPRQDIFNGEDRWYGLTRESLVDFERKWAEYEKAYRLYASEYRSLATKVVDVLMEMGVPQTKIEQKSRSYKLITVKLSDSISAFFCPEKISNRPYLETAKKWLEKREDDNEKLEAAKAHSELTDRAIKYLQDRGKIIGVDFSSSYAVGLANETAFSIKVKEAQEEGNLRSFSGDDNCENCGGWDGISHRCDCGNRRVSWSRGGNFEDLYIYGEAY